MILIGVATLAVCFALAGFVKSFNVAVYALFVVIGFAWAAINVNSYPMVVEISRSGDVGKYTGYYYTFSMAAQILTPILSGWLLEHVGYHTLFPYATVMAGLAFCTMLFVRHGDSRPEAPRSVIEHLNAED
jgi:MFS family permease